MLTTTTGFDRAVAGDAALMVRCDGVEELLEVQRWQGAAGGEDQWLLDRCHGSVLDLGCGPGRLVAALAERGLPALGVDHSTSARVQCRRRRAAMVCADLFGPLPGEGEWCHVLLADGNIGIGGDPLVLLHRARMLLAPGGTLLVEAASRPGLLWQGTVRVRTAAGLGDPVPWASVGADALTELAAAAGLARTATYTGQRSFVELLAPAP